MTAIKILSVGDPHVQPRDIPECERLIAFVENLIEDHRPHILVWMGDLHHTHEIVNTWVTDFWIRSLRDLKTRFPDLKIIILKGNHDAPHDAAPNVHSLHPYREFAQVVDGPSVLEFGPKTPLCSICMEPQREVWDGLVYCGMSCANGHGGADPVNTGTWNMLLLPYTRSSQEFVDVCRQYKHCNVLYCHQTFNGGKYDNGFYAKDGVDPQEIPQQLVISGHIHTGQEFDKVWYVGSPRWLTVSDANQDRFVWLIEHNFADGSIASREAFSTDECCRKVVTVLDTPESPADPEKLKSSWQVTVDVQGPPDWVEARRQLWAGKAKIRTRTQRQKMVRVRESDGIAVALRKYVGAFQATYRTPPEKLLEMVQQRITI